MKHVKKIKLHTKRTMDKKKELYEENLSRIHKKEMIIIKNMIVDLSEALMMQSSSSTKDKLNKSLLELQYLSYSDADRITISDDRVSRLDSDFNPLYTDQEMTVRSVRMDDNVTSPLSVDKDVPC
jgi:hypothetical protein